MFPNALPAVDQV